MYSQGYLLWTKFEKRGEINEIDGLEFVSKPIYSLKVNKKNHLKKKIVKGKNKM